MLSGSSQLLKKASSGGRGAKPADRCCCCCCPLSSSLCPLPSVLASSWPLLLEATGVPTRPAEAIHSPDASMLRLARPEKVLSGY